MGLNQSRAAVGLAACVLAATAASASAATTTDVRSRSGLSAVEILGGSMRFTTPAAWHVTPKSGVYTARFTVDGGPQCTIEVNASIRGKGTRQTAIQQARHAILNPVVAGRRAGGVYRVGPTEPPRAGSSRSWLYGIAVVRVARRRFGQLRIFASFAGADCSAQAAPDGAVTKAMAKVLRRARSHLRVVRLT